MSELQILAIDDDVEVRSFLVDLLEDERCRVHATGDPQEALSLLKERRFHMVTLDLMMPDCSGMELFEDIRKVDPDVAVIILTGYPTLESATTAINLEVAAYMRKPFSGEDLRETIARVARKKGITVRREDELHVTISTSIRALRRKEKLTLKELAQRSGLSASAISQIERGENTASISALFKVATALGVSVRDLLGDF